MDATNTIDSELFGASERSMEAHEQQNSNWCYGNQQGLECIINVKICAAPEDSESGYSDVYSVETAPSGHPFKVEVQRTYQDFLELDEFLRTSVDFSRMSGLPQRLPQLHDGDTAPLSSFLQQILLQMGGFLWNCPRLLCFLDDTHGKQSLRDAQVGVLNQKLQDLSTAYRTLEIKLYDAQDTWETISMRMMRLETLHMDHLARHEEREEAADFAEPDYEKSIAIHNENNSGDIEDYFDPNGSDFRLAPDGAVSMAPTHPEGPRSTQGVEGVDCAGEEVLDDHITVSVPVTGSANEITNADYAPEQPAAALRYQQGTAQVESSTPHFLEGIPEGRVVLQETAVPFSPSSSLDTETENTSLEGAADAANKENSTDESVGDEVAKSDLEQLRERVADVVPARRPAPPRVHSYKSCKDLHVSIIPSNVNPDWRDVAVDSVLSLLKPYDAQLLYRSSARAFLGRAVRHSLNAKLFESGLHALQAFLPDDPIRLTVLLWRGNSTNWLANLSDKLRVLEQPGGAGRQGGSAGISGNTSFEDDNFNDANNFDIDNEPKPTGDHMITNINPSTNNGHSRMLCTIDTVPVEIMPNARSDLCFLALVEEIAQLVGKNELFKCSLLLIRGWWTYESSGYVGVSTKSFLSDSVLCVLVCSIFNQYHAVINQPLQALCVFLAEYSDVKWSDVAVTLQGVVPFHSNSVLDNQPWLREPLPSELVTSAILQKHCDFYHMSSASNSRASATPQVVETPIAETPSDSKEGTRKETTLSSGITTVCSTPYSSSEVPGRDIMSPCFNTILSTSSTKLTPPSSAPPTPGGATPYGQGTVSTAATVAAAAAFLTVKEPSKRTPSDSHCYSPTAVRNFQKRVINVVHPLTNANMISTSLTLERVTKISQIFETGARDLGTALKLAIRSDAEEDRDQLSVQSHFNSFFRNTLGRFAGGWRPDVFANTLPKVPHFDTSKSYDGLQDLSNASSRSLDRSPAVFTGISLTDLFDQIRYIDLVLVGRVSESALLSLSLDILVGRGVLPVGEIGKSLQDIAPTRNLSGKIKEKYGGLKKFLERYPEEVVICADHPFNPHVFLRKPLNRTDLELIAKGIIPPHLRKAMALRNKMRGGAISGIGQDGHSGSGSNYHMGALHGMEGNIRHMNPNMERNMNSGGAGMNLLNGYGSHGNMGGMQGHGQGQGMNRMNHQMQQQAYKSQQQALALAQQQLFSHQQAQSGQFRGPDPSHGHSPQNGGQTGNQYFFPMRDGDQMVGPRSDQVLIRGSAQVGVNQSGGGLGGALLGQDFSQSQGRRAGVGGMNGMGLELNLNAPLSETYGAFGPRRGLGDTSHSALLGSDGLGLGRSLSTFNSVIDGGQARRYGELSLSGSVLGVLSSDNLAHDRSNSGSGGTSYELNSERPLERRFSEPFRDHADSLAAGAFNPSLSLSGSAGNSAPPSRRLSASMHQAAKNFSERDKIERDRALGIEPWDNPLYSMDRDAIDERLRERDRYAENDFNLESTSELFASSTLGSNNQMLSDDREREREREPPVEYYDPRTQRAYQQSLGRDSYLRGLESPQEHHTHHQGGQPSAGAGPSLFLQQREDDMLFEQEYSMRDRDRQHQLQRQQEEDDQHQRLILQNQQAGTQRQSFRPTQNVFDPKKWI